MPYSLFGPCNRCCDEEPPLVPCGTPNITGGSAFGQLVMLNDNISLKAQFITITFFAIKPGFPPIAFGCILSYSGGNSWFNQMNQLDGNGNIVSAKFERVQTGLNVAFLGGDSNATWLSLHKLIEYTFETSDGLIFSAEKDENNNVIHSSSSDYCIEFIQMRPFMTPVMVRQGKEFSGNISGCQCNGGASGPMIASAAGCGPFFPNAWIPGAGGAGYIDNIIPAGISLAWATSSPTGFATTPCTKPGEFLKKDTTALLGLVGGCGGTPGSIATQGKLAPMSSISDAFNPNFGGLTESFQAFPNCVVEVNVA